MSEFVDRLLLRLRSPAEVQKVLAPTNDPNRTRLRALFDAAFVLPFARLHAVQDLEVRNIEILEVQQPLFWPRRTSGTWTQTIPSHARTEVFCEGEERCEPAWVDMTVEALVKVVLEVDPGEVESIMTKEISGFSTLDEFRNHFRVFDLDAFMADHGISTVEELRTRFHYLLTEIRGRPPRPFNPNDPANQHRFSLRLAILIREERDLVAGLRTAKLARGLLERTVAYQPRVGVAEVRTPYAPLVIFPQGGPFKEEDVRALFATARILAVFVPPS